MVPGISWTMMFPLQSDNSKRRHSFEIGRDILDHNSMRQTMIPGLSTRWSDRQWVGCFFLCYYLYQSCSCHLWTTLHNKLNSSHGKHEYFAHVLKYFNGMIRKWNSDVHFLAGGEQVNSKILGKLKVNLNRFLWAYARFIMAFSYMYIIHIDHIYPVKLPFSSPHPP